MALTPIACRLMGVWGRFPLVSNGYILEFVIQFAASVGVKIRTVKAAHFFHAVALVIRKCVGVQVQCCGCLCVTKDAGKNFYIHSGLQRSCCEGVPQGMEVDIRKPRCFQRALEKIFVCSGVIYLAGNHGKDVGFAVEDNTQRIEDFLLFLPVFH